GGLLSWRWSFVGLAGLSATVALLLVRSLPADLPRRGRQAETLRSVPRALRDLPTTAVLLAASTALLGWMLFGTYLAAFYRDVHVFPAWALGAAGMVLAIG